MRVSQLLLSTLFFAAATMTHAAEQLDSIVVEVNDTIITESQLQKRIKDVRAQILTKNSKAPSTAQLRGPVLERLIIDELQLSRANQFGLKMNDLQLNQQLEQMARNNKMTLPQLRQKLLRDGVSYKEFREQIRQNTIIRRLQKGRVYDQIRVSDAEIDQFLINQKKNSKDYRYRLNHILIPIPEAASSEQLQKARNKAENILGLVNSGNRFEEMAIEHSAGHNALEGGDLGWRSASELPAIFVNAVMKLKKGEITGILQSPTGFHILKLADTGTGKKVIINETHSRHILIKTDELVTDDDARSQLAQIRKEIKAGADFAEMAKNYSQDPGSKIKGGDLGWSMPGQMVKQFESVTDSLGKGQLSEPFKSPFGWHLVQLLERRKSDKTALVERNRAYQAIQRSKADEALQLWLRSLQDEAYIKYHNPADKPRT